MGGRGSGRREGKREEGGEAADLLLELGELAALRLEGEDGPVDVRDLGLLHEDVPHLREHGQGGCAGGGGGLDGHGITAVEPFGAGGAKDAGG
jgi:hypothetical protein